MALNAKYMAVVSEQKTYPQNDANKVQLPHETMVGQNSRFARKGHAFRRSYRFVLLYTNSHVSPSALFPVTSSLAYVYRQVYG